MIFTSSTFVWHSYWEQLQSEGYNHWKASNVESGVFVWSHRKYLYCRFLSLFSNLLFHWLIYTQQQISVHLWLKESGLVLAFHEGCIHICAKHSENLQFHPQIQTCLVYTMTHQLCTSLSRKHLVVMLHVSIYVTEPILLQEMTNGWLDI